MYEKIRCMLNQAVLLSLISGASIGFGLPIGLLGLEKGSMGCMITGGILGILCIIWGLQSDKKTAQIKKIIKEKFPESE